MCWNVVSNVPNYLDVGEGGLFEFQNPRMENVTFNFAEGKNGGNDVN